MNLLRFLPTGPLLDLARKIFGTDSAGVTIVDDRRMFIVEGRGMLSPKASFDHDAWPSGFCCWTVTGTHATVLTVEDSLKDARCACPRWSRMLPFYHSFHAS